MASPAAQFQALRARTLANFIQLILNTGPSAYSDSGGMSGLITKLNTLATNVLSGAVTVAYAQLLVNLYYHNWPVVGYYQNDGFLSDLQYYCSSVGIDPAIWNGML
jgi:hypothetical protein